MKPPIFPEHLEDLRKSGLSDQTIEGAGLYSVEGEKAAELLDFDVPQLQSALVFPYESTEDTFSRLKVFPSLKDKDGHTVKYLQKKGSGSHLYIPKPVGVFIKDPTKPIAIAEGEKKTLRLGQEGVLAIGIGGVWNWRDGESRAAINDFDKIAWVDRPVTLYFDSDSWSRPDLLRAIYALGKELEGRGASVEAIIIPQSGEEKTGVDDFLVNQSLEALKNLKKISLSHAAFSEAKKWHKRWKQEQDKQNATGEARPTQATQLMEIAEESQIKLWHTPSSISYATVQIKDQTANFPVRSQNFRRWLAGQYFETYRQSPSSQALQDAINTLEGMAEFEGEEHPVFTRLAKFNDTIYLDLVNERWEAIEISVSGWRLIPSDKLPIKFRRVKGMLHLPQPIPGGSIDELRPFVNVANESSWQMLIGWLLSTLCPSGPYPIAVFNGEQGSSKSTRTRILRALVDPSAAPLRSEPREVRDLMIAANNGWIIALDNMSHVSPWLSDALCRLSTGGGFGTRMLYQDDEEMIFDAQRPIILNGIEELSTRADLLDRAWIDCLPSIPESQRKTEAEFWRDFEIACPRILGALLDAISVALRRLPETKLDNSPRMADFARWVTAAEPALGWESGAFLKTYTSNRSEANELALEGSLVAAAILRCVDSEWQGTASELLDVLDENADEKTRKSQTWPKNPRSLSNALRRITPNLRAIGIEIFFERTPNRRKIRIIRPENQGVSSSLSSQKASIVIPSSSLRHLEEPASEKIDDNDNHDDLLPSFSNPEVGEEVVTWKA